MPSVRHKKTVLYNLPYFYQNFSTLQTGKVWYNLDKQPNIGYNYLAKSGTSDKKKTSGGLSCCNPGRFYKEADVLTQAEFSAG